MNYVIASEAKQDDSRHCEERSDEAKITAPPATQVDSRRGKDCNSFMGLDTVTTEGFLGSWWFFKGLWLLVFLDPDFKLSFWTVWFF